MCFSPVLRWPRHSLHSAHSWTLTYRLTADLDMHHYSLSLSADEWPTIQFPGAQTALLISSLSLTCVLVFQENCAMDDATAVAVEMGFARWAILSGYRVSGTFTSGLLISNFQANGR